MLNLKSALSKINYSGKVVVFTLSAILLIVIFTWHIGGSPAGRSPAEASAIAASINHHTLLHNAIGLPHNVFLYAANHFHHASLWVARLISAVFGLIFVGCFAYILKIWFGSMIAYIASIIFALTPLVLLVSRSGTADVLILSPLALSASYFWVLRHPKQQYLGLPLLAMSTVLTLYSPGGIFIIIAAAIYARSVLAEILRKAPTAGLIAAISLAIILIIPLTYTLYINHLQLRLWLLMPLKFGGVVSYLKTTGGMIMGLFIHTTNHSVYQIGRLPLLTVTQLVLAAFGIYAMWGRARNKVYGLIALLAFGILAAGINDNFAFLLYSLVGASVFLAAGLRFLMLEWRTVFPRNPLPRALAVVLVFAILAIQLLYGVRYSLIAWPATVATRQAYVLR